MRTIALVFACSLAAASFGQLTPFEFGAGYAQSGPFDKDTGGRGKLKGLELSISQSVVSFPILGEARIGASVLLGGVGNSGDDTDGTVFRLFARYKTIQVGSNSLYGLAGIFWARADGRGGSFDAFDGTGVDVGGGLPLGSILPGLPGGALELIFHQASDPQLRGWSLVFVVRM
jgi:hypothetical protein